jgi:AcrR family transcriptional regulator
MERRRQGAVEEIVRTAIDLFGRDGFEATTVDQVAAASGCSRRTFYRYFGSKEDVMFHDFPAAFEQLRRALEDRLDSGLGPWEAVTESVTEMIGRFADDEAVPLARMDLWLREPALRDRYMQHVAAAERVIAECLSTHRGTKPERDDLAQLIAISAVGAYRATFITHSPSARSGKLTRHLRELLATLGRGLEDGRRS